MLSRCLAVFASIFSYSLFRSSAMADDIESTLNREWERMEQSLAQKYASYENGEQKAWEEMKRRIQEKWADGELPSQKQYIKYFEGDASRVKVDYEQGTVIVEALTSKTEKSRLAKEKIKEALLKSMKENLLEEDQLDTKKSIGDFISEVASSVRSLGKTKGKDKQERHLYQVSFHLVPNHIKLRALKYLPIVEKWSAKYKLDPAFVLGVIRQESAFNPRARSPVGALGLMQIMPQYAGKEVLTTVLKKPITPDPEFLYDPEKNIIVGTTYIQLLRDQYFPNVEDKAKQLYYITCGYNWGPHRVQLQIKKGRLPSSLDSSEAFSRLLKIVPDETKTYLQNVTRYAVEFKGIEQ